MKYQLRFTAGERQGESFPLIQEQAISIGRSHSNTVRVSNPDVSGRHVIVRTDRGGNIVVEVLSSRITKHNGKDVKIGDMLEMTDGAVIQMGSDTAFVIERCQDDETATKISDEEKTAPPQPSPVSGDNTRTVPSQLSPVAGDTSRTVTGRPSPVAGDTSRTVTKRSAPARESSAEETIATKSAEKMDVEAADENETVAFQTRVASDDELDNIKKAFRTKHRKKVFLIAFPIFLFFALAVFLYFYLRPETEEFASWPKDRKGAFLNEYKQLSPYLALVFPKVPGGTVKPNGAALEVNTKIGKQMDVRLHIIATGFNDPATLKLDHPAAFDLWMEKMREKEPTLNFGGDRTTVFLNRSRGAGIPLSTVSYTRRVGNDDFWGYALFLRNAASVHSVMIEVPVSDRWRSEPFMRSQATTMVLYAIRRTEEHWEGTSSYRKTTDVATDLREAANFMEREAPVYWGRIFYLLRGALIKSALAGDKEKVAEAQGMLIKLRKQQTIWYSTQKLAYQYAARNEDRLTLDSIQATGESVFSSEFQYSDFRYDLIRRKDWK